MNGSTSNEDEPITFVGIVPLTTTQPMRSAHCVSALWSLFMRHLSVSVSFCSQLGRCWSWFFILSFRNFSTVDFREMAEEAPELKRDSTMTVTAKVRERSKAREHRKIFNAKVPCNAIEWLFLFFFASGRSTISWRARESTRRCKNKGAAKRTRGKRRGRCCEQTKKNFDHGSNRSGKSHSSKVV